MKICNYSLCLMLMTLGLAFESMSTTAQEATPGAAWRDCDDRPPFSRRSSGETRRQLPSRLSGHLVAIRRVQNPSFVGEPFVIELELSLDSPLPVRNAALVLQIGMTNFAACGCSKQSGQTEYLHLRRADFDRLQSGSPLFLKFETDCDFGNYLGRLDKSLLKRGRNGAIAPMSTCFEDRTPSRLSN